MATCRIPLGQRLKKGVSQVSTPSGSIACLFELSELCQVQDINSSVASIDKRIHQSRQVTALFGHLTADRLDAIALRCRHRHPKALEKAGDLRAVPVPKSGRGSCI
jgi:hypothetical protein